METNATHLGLDVHKDSIAVAVLRPGQLEPDQRVIANTPEAVRKLIARHEDRASLLVCYEAGPTGYEIQRLLASLDVSCDVIAPSLIPRRSGDRVKTDRLDARNLARLHRAGELTPIRVPTSEEEAVRDLVRVREDLKDDRRRIQHRTKAFLLRHGRRCPDHRSGWSRRYLLWVDAQRFDDDPAQLAFNHLVAALRSATAQLDSIDHALLDAANRPPMAEAVARLRVMRGIDTLSALTIAAEVCDFRRFPAASAAWSYRHKPAVGPAMRKRCEGQPPLVHAYSWRAQLRLHERFKAVAARKNRNVAAVAVARELAGFVWGLMNERTEC